MKNTPKISLHLPRSLSPARHKSRNKSPSPSPTDVSEPSGEKSTTLKPGTAAVVGSATGNPRNKCALQPGHSLMDWIRLGNSGKDLSGTGGRLRPVTPKELEQHNQMGDAWIAIRGRVYNVTEYMEYHPGGPEELMRGVGRDATKLFDQVHAWVNYESLLTKCLVGPLRYPEMNEGEFNKILFGDSKTSPKKESKGIPDLLRKSMESLKGNKSKSDSKNDNTLNSLTDSDYANKSSSESSLNINESKSSEKSGSSNSTVKVADVVIKVGDGGSNTSDEYSSSKFKYPKFTLTSADKSDSTESKPMEQSPKNVTPKFDWIQKMDSIMLIFYTKALSNAMCSVELIKDPSQNLKIKLSYDTNTYQFEVILENIIKWPCNVNINYETGKFEITLIKEMPKIWNSFGTLKTLDVVDQTIIINENSLEFTVVDKLNVTHNTNLILLKCAKDEVITFPIGYHSRIFYCLEEMLSRAYTPVPASLVSQYKPLKWTPDMICFMVKKYDQGEASTWLTSKKTDDRITISRPLGSFPLKSLQDATQFFLIAAGTGLTPMCQIILFALQRRNPRCKRVDLLFFNRSEKDILWYDQLSDLASKDERFHLTNTLSTPSSLWEGQRGHVNQSFLINYFVKTYQEELNVTDTTASSPTKAALDNLLKILHKELFICICGPTAFTTLVKTLLIGLGSHEEQIHCFLG